jgi:hypothetical protein
MGRFKIIISGIFLISALSTCFAFSQNVSPEMINAFSKGDVEVLSNFFHERLKVSITDHEYTCSKAQAKEIVRDFFNKNKPGSFEIIFEGGKADSNFAIGTLKTNGGNYRVNIFFRKTNTHNLVHLLHIEKDNVRAF